MTSTHSASPLPCVTPLKRRFPLLFLCLPFLLLSGCPFGDFIQTSHAIRGFNYVPYLAEEALNKPFSMRSALSHRITGGVSTITGITYLLPVVSNSSSISAEGGTVFPEDVEGSPPSSGYLDRGKTLATVLKEVRLIASGGAEEKSPEALFLLDSLRGGRLNAMTERLVLANLDFLPLDTLSRFLPSIFSSVGGILLGPAQGSSPALPAFPYYQSYRPNASTNLLAYFLQENGYASLRFLCSKLVYDFCARWSKDPILSTTSQAYLVCCKGTTDVSINSGNYLQFTRDMFQSIPIADAAKPSYLKSLENLPPLKIAPANKFTAQSPWPVAHRTPAAQGSSPISTIDGTRALKTDAFDRFSITSTPITLFYTEDLKYLWGSSWTTIFKIDRRGSDLKLVDYLTKPLSETFKDTFHGSYSILSKEGLFLTSAMQRIEAYMDVPYTSGLKIMKHPSVYWLSNDVNLLSEKEVFVALNITHDGYLVWITNKGRVGILSRHPDQNFNHSLAMHILRDADGKEVEVSNAIACDEEGGIYIVSSSLMHKLIWDGSTLSVVWETHYNVSSSTNSGGTVRLGQGSGSTPSLMGEPGSLYVVISDDSELMNVLVIDAYTGELISYRSATFGDPNASASLSEQSLLVHGWRIAIVNNTPPDYILGQNLINKLFGTLQDFGIGGAAGALGQGSWPVIAGVAPKGVEQMEYDPVTRSLRTVWVNKEISIPNGIPTMSSSTGLMYGVGKRGFLLDNADAYRGMWTLEVLDWWTGESKFHQNLGIGPWSNSIYAATEIGPNEIVSGTTSGLIRVREA